MFNKENIIILDEKISSKEELFTILSNKAIELGISDSPEDLINGFKERESLGSTGFQDGFGIPHCKSKSVKKPAAIFAKSLVPIEWDTLDNNPMTEIIALLIPEDGASEHLRVLAQISRKLMNKEFRANVKSTTDIETLLNLLKEINS